MTDQVSIDSPSHAAAENRFAPPDAATRQAVRLPRPPRGAGASPLPSAVDVTPWLRVFGEPLLPEDQARALMAASRRRMVRAADALWPSDERATNLVLLLGGEVALGSVAQGGMLRSERSVKAPAWLDVTAAWLGEPHALQGQALTDVVLAEVPVADVRRLLQVHVGLAERFIVTLAREVNTLTVSARNLVTKDAPARLAEWLIRHCERNATDTTAVVKMHERKRDVATQLGVTPETLSRLMRSLAQQGLIAVHGYTVHLLDIEGLNRIAA